MAGEDKLENDRKNLEWMKRVYATKEYWSEELQYGHRWSKDAPIKDYRYAAQMVERYVRPFLPSPQVGAVVELGPGGGRWTPELLRLGKHVHLVDISESVLDVCRERFKYYHNVEYHLVDDRADLSFLVDSSIDLIFSWGVLVHVATGIVENYVSQFRRILSPSGVAIVQHGNLGTNLSQNRSNVTREWFEQMVERHGLTAHAQIGTSEGFYPEYREGKQQVFLDTLEVLKRTVTR